MILGLQHGVSSSPAILRLPNVRARTGLSRSTIYLRVAQGTFPPPVSLGSRAVGWIESEVQLWLEQQIKASRKNSPPIKGNWRPTPHQRNLRYPTAR
jgi:prophage regulatory protein